MGRSWNWPDLRSQIYKFRDISFVDTVTLTNSWKFHIDRSTALALVQAQTFWREGHFTWPGDLTLGRPGLIFAHNMQNWCGNQYAKTGGATRWRFSDICEKPEGRRKEGWKGRLKITASGRLKTTSDSRTWLTTTSSGSSNKVFSSSKSASAWNSTAHGQQQDAQAADPSLSCK